MLAPLPDRQVRHGPSRQAALPAPAPARGDPQGYRGPVLRADHRYRLREEPRLHRANRGPRAQKRVRARRPGHRRLSHERPRQQPGRGAREVPRQGLPGRPIARALRALHGAGTGRRPRGHPQRSAGHPPDELHDAGAAAYAKRRPRAGEGRPGPQVPRLRRVAHLPGPPGRGHRDAHPPLPPRLRRRRRLHRHLRHDGKRREQRGTAARGGEGVTGPVRGGFHARTGDRRNAGAGDAGDRHRGPCGPGRHSSGHRLGRRAALRLRVVPGASPRLLDRIHLRRARGGGHRQAPQTDAPQARRGCRGGRERPWRAGRGSPAVRRAGARGARGYRAAAIRVGERRRGTIVADGRRARGRRAATLRPSAPSLAPQGLRPPSKRIQPLFPLRLPATPIPDPGRYGLGVARTRGAPPPGNRQEGGQARRTGKAAFSAGLLSSLRDRLLPGTGRGTGGGRARPSDTASPRRPPRGR